MVSDSLPGCGNDLNRGEGLSSFGYFFGLSVQARMEVSANVRTHIAALFSACIVPKSHPSPSALISLLPCLRGQVGRSRKSVRYGTGPLMVDMYPGNSSQSSQ